MNIAVKQMNEFKSLVAEWHLVLIQLQAAHQR